MNGLQSKNCTELTCIGSNVKWGAQRLGTFNVSSWKCFSGCLRVPSIYTYIHSKAEEGRILLLSIRARDGHVRDRMRLQFPMYQKSLIGDRTSYLATHMWVLGMGVYTHILHEQAHS